MLVILIHFGDIMISIITASYNYENYIKQTIDSIISQSYPDWELIVVDDGSKDNSLEVIKSYCEKDSRIKLFTHENNQNLGLCETLKLGISKCSGVYIAFLESDDLWEKDCLLHKVEAISQNPNAAILVNDVELIGDKDFVNQYVERQKEYFISQNNLFSAPSFDIKEFMRNNYFPTFSCVTVKKFCIENVKFNSPSKPNLDWYLWIQILKMTDEIVFIPYKDTLWRIHEGSYISSGKKSDYALFFKKMHNILFKQDLPRILFRISEFFHKENVQKKMRPMIFSFDRFLVDKHPHPIKVKRYVKE